MACAIVSRVATARHALRIGGVAGSGRPPAKGQGGSCSTPIRGTYVQRSYFEENRICPLKRGDRSPLSDSDDDLIAPRIAKMLWLMGVLYRVRRTPPPTPDSQGETDGRRGNDDEVQPEGGAHGAD